MNFSTVNNVIWISPECTGGEILRSIFKNYDFFRFKDENSTKTINLLETDESCHENTRGLYENFTKIVTIRNPYERIWQCYLKFYTKSYIPKNFDENREKFNDFLNKSFIKIIGGVKCDRFFDSESYIYKNQFLNYSPDEVIRFENMFEDTLNLSFIKTQPYRFKIEDFKTQTSKIKQDYNFKNYYSFETAQKVFIFYKKLFISYDYDPFSFTNDILSQKEKIKFVHSYD